MIGSIIAAVLFGVSLSACPGDMPPLPPPAVSLDELVTLIEASPCDSIPPEPTVVVALTGRPTHQNEIHDCQRLVHVPAAGPHVFGPLVGVYPLKAAMDLTSVSDFEGPGVAVASVFNWAKPNTPGSKYGPLGIDEGWSCLWLKVDDDQWSGTIAPTTVRCEYAVAPTSGWSLRGIRETASSNGPPVPPTARWGWSTGNLHYIGIKCADGWCSIGRQGFQPSPPPATAVARGLSAGWYDEQHLAVPAGSGMGPGPLAFIFPTDSLLALRDVEDPAVLHAAFAGGFDVATIEVHAGAGSHPYGGKFNLAFNNNVGTSTIWLQVDTTKYANDAQPVRYRNGTTAMDTTAIYLPGTRHAAQGAVRWRWQASDETAWISCKSGCCDAQEL